MQSPSLTEFSLNFTLSRNSDDVRVCLFKFLGSFLLKSFWMSTTSWQPTLFRPPPKERSWTDYPISPCACTWYNNTIPCGYNILYENYIDSHLSVVFLLTSHSKTNSSTNLPFTSRVGVLPTRYFLFLVRKRLAKRLATFPFQINNNNFYWSTTTCM